MYHSEPPHFILFTLCKKATSVNITKLQGVEKVSPVSASHVLPSLLGLLKSICKCQLQQEACRRAASWLLSVMCLNPEHQDIVTDQYFS